MITVTNLVWKNKISSWPVVITTTRTEVCIADMNGRWLDHIGVNQVVKVEHVKTHTVTGRTHTVTGSFGGGSIEAGFEVTFKCGAIGFVSQRPHGQELDALIVGTKGYLHGLAVWRKRGHIVGTPVPWFRTQKSARAHQNPNTAPRTCAAELYARAAGKPWGDAS